MLNQTSKKMALWFLGIIGVGIAVWLVGFYMNSEDRAKRDVLKYFEDLQAQYESDTYGGATPEETLQLFIAALEAEDIELASKYFLPDERGEIKQDLVQASEQQNGLDGVVERMKNLKLARKDDQEAFFTIVGQDNVIQIQVTLSKNENNVWKITDL